MADLKMDREQALAERCAILEATLENMEQGVSLVDGDLSVLAFNRKFLELLDFPAEHLEPGFHMEKAFPYNAQRREYGEGDIEEQVRRRIELAKRFEPHIGRQSRRNSSRRVHCSNSDRWRGGVKGHTTPH